MTNSPSIAASGCYRPGNGSIEDGGRRELSRARPCSPTRSQATQTHSDGSQSLIHARQSPTEAVEKITPHGVASFARSRDGGVRQELAKGIGHLRAAGARLERTRKRIGEADDGYKISMPELVRARAESMGGLHLGLERAHQGQVRHGVSLEIALGKLHHNANGAIGVIYKHELFALGHFPIGQQTSPTQST
jgi:hypothetical protein